MNHALNDFIEIYDSEEKPFNAVTDMNASDVNLAQVRGTMPADWAQKNLSNANITLFDNYPDALRSIAQGRNDAIVDVVDFQKFCN